MSIPQYKGKHGLQTLVSPEGYIDYCKMNGRYPKRKAPRSVIMCYQPKIFEYVKTHFNLTSSDGFTRMIHYIEETDGEVAIASRFGIGSPIACTIVEELIAWGISSIVSLGTAGSLQKHIAIGDIILCDQAIRDEGTSFHYLPPSKYAYPSKKLTDKLQTQLEKNNIKYHRGTTWTTDAPYRETVEEAAFYQKEGVATVEMEASALFAVGEFRKVDVAAIFTISDSLANLKWEPHFHSGKIQQGLELIFKTVLDSLK